MPDVIVVDDNVTESPTITYHLYLRSPKQLQSLKQRISTTLATGSAQRLLLADIFDQYTIQPFMSMTGESENPFATAHKMNRQHKGILVVDILVQLHPQLTLLPILNLIPHFRNVIQS
nr:hypothetical protein L203_03683 [Cryptococcus depauperatus CBS 7841]